MKENFKPDFSEELDKFCLFDDDFMQKCFEDNQECAELVLRIILAEPDLKVTALRHQHRIKNLQGHSVELDIFAVDAGGRRYNLEVQRTNTGAKPKRARYYGSILDANALKPGDNYINLPETYVIFITEKDVLGDGLPIYEIDRYVGQNQRYFGDEEHIIYVNGQYRDDTPLGWLMHDFSCTRAEDMHYKLLADRVGYLKGTEKGRMEMCEIMDRIYASGEQAGLELGLETGRFEERRSMIFKFMFKQNLTFESACDLFDIPEKERDKYR